jgi:tetratricopeptide (TPR) repeat protein
VIEGCSAIIAAGREPAEKLFQAYNNRRQQPCHDRRHRRAIDDYSAALKLQPGEFVVWMSRCHQYAIVGDLQAALADCNEALRLAPSVPAALGTRGLVLLQLGRFDEAIADHDAGLRIYAKSEISLYGRGVAKRKKKGDVADVFVQRGVSP